MTTTDKTFFSFGAPRPEYKFGINVPVRSTSGGFFVHAWKGRDYVHIGTVQTGYVVKRRQSKNSMKEWVSWYDVRVVLDGKTYTVKDVHELSMARA